VPYWVALVLVCKLQQNSIVQLFNLAGKKNKMKFSVSLSVFFFNWQWISLSLHLSINPSLSVMSPFILNSLANSAVLYVSTCIQGVRTILTAVSNFNAQVSTSHVVEVSCLIFQVLQCNTSMLLLL
jgi:hypothetical protein